MPKTSFHDPNKFDKFIIKMVGGTKRLSNQAEHDGEILEKDEFDPDTVIGEIEEILNRFLKPDELDVLLERTLVGSTFQQIGEKHSIDPGNAQKKFKKSLTKCRCHYTAVFIHSLLSKQGGCTIDPNTFEQSGFVGYAVSKKDFRLPFPDIPSLQEISNYLWDHHEILNIGVDRDDPSPLYVGGCQTLESVWVLEMTYVLPLYCRAWALAILEDQATIFDFQTEEILQVLYPLPPSQ